MHIRFDCRTHYSTVHLPLITLSWPLQVGFKRRDFCCNKGKCWYISIICCECTVRVAHTWLWNTVVENTEKARERNVDQINLMIFCYLGDEWHPELRVSNMKKSTIFFFKLNFCHEKKIFFQNFFFRIKFYIWRPDCIKVKVAEFWRNPGVLRRYPRPFGSYS